MATINRDELLVRDARETSSHRKQLMKIRRLSDIKTSFPRDVVTWNGLEKELVEVKSNYHFKVKG